MTGLLLESGVDVFYEDVRDMQPIYVLVSNTKSRVAKVITNVTNTPYNHASISFDKNLNNMYGFNMNGGINIENLYENYAPDATFSLYRINVPIVHFQSMKQKAEAMYSHRDEYKYSFKGLISYLTGKQITKSNKEFFCSQFVTWLFESNGIKIFKKPAWKVSPYDFATNKNFQFIYRGKVKNYHPDRVKK